MPMLRFLVKALILSLIVCGCDPSPAKTTFDDSPYDGVKASNEKMADHMREAIRIDRAERTKNR